MEMDKIEKSNAFAITPKAPSDYQNCIETAIIFSRLKNNQFARVVRKDVDRLYVYPPAQLTILRSGIPKFAVFLDTNKKEIVAVFESDFSLAGGKVFVEGEVASMNIVHFENEDMHANIYDYNERWTDE